MNIVGSTTSTNTYALTAMGRNLQGIKGVQSKKFWDTVDYEYNGFTTSTNTFALTAMGRNLQGIKGVQWKLLGYSQSQTGGYRAQVIQKYVIAHACTHPRARTHAHAHTHTYTYTHTHTHMHTHTRTHTHIHTRTHTHTHTRTRTHTNTHTHIHTHMLAAMRHNLQRLCTKMKERSYAQQWSAKRVSLKPEQLSTNTI